MIAYSNVFKIDWLLSMHLHHFLNGLIINHKRQRRDEWHFKTDIRNTTSLNAV